MIISLQILSAPTPNPNGKKLVARADKSEREKNRFDKKSAPLES